MHSVCVLVTLWVCGHFGRSKFKAKVYLDDDTLDTEIVYKIKLTGSFTGRTPAVELLWKILTSNAIGWEVGALPCGVISG